MAAHFSPCIAIGVDDKKKAADDFCSLFGGEITDQVDGWIEVKAGPFVFYFGEDGTHDLAFEVVVDDEQETLAAAMAKGFTIDEVTTKRERETFVFSPDGVRIHLQKRG